MESLLRQFPFMPSRSVNQTRPKESRIVHLVNPFYEFEGLNQIAPKSPLHDICMSEMVQEMQGSSTFPSKIFSVQSAPDSTYHSDRVCFILVGLTLAPFDAEYFTVWTWTMCRQPGCCWYGWDVVYPVQMYMHLNTSCMYSVHLIFRLIGTEQFIAASFEFPCMYHSNLKWLIYWIPWFIFSGCHKIRDIIIATVILFEGRRIFKATDIQKRGLHVPPRLAAHL